MLQNLVDTVLNIKQHSGSWQEAEHKIIRIWSEDPAVMAYSRLTRPEYLGLDGSYRALCPQTWLCLFCIRRDFPKVTREQVVREIKKAYDS